MKARRFSRICSRPCQSAMPRLQVASSARQLTPPPNVLSSISFQNASSHFGGSVFDMVRVVASFSSCIRFVIASFAPPNVRRLAPSTPNMGSTGHGRNYARSNKRVERRETACNQKSSALLGINAEKCLVTNKSRVGHPEVIQARRPAHGSTELVAVKRLAGIPIQVAEKIVGVEGGVADEVVGAAMKSVRARFGDLRDNSSGAATVFSGKV